MDKGCSTCIHKEGSCYPSTTIFDKDKTCKSYAPDYEGYIAELKADNDARKFAMAMSEKVEKQLRKENVELKEKLKPENCLKSLAKSGLVKFTCENGNEHDQLTKAKEIIKKLKALYLSPVVTKDDVKKQDEILAEAEQFLKDSKQKG